MVSRGGDEGRAGFRTSRGRRGVGIRAGRGCRSCCRRQPALGRRSRTGLGWRSRRRGPAVGPELGRRRRRSLGGWHRPRSEVGAARRLGLRLEFARGQPSGRIGSDGRRSRRDLRPGLKSFARAGSPSADERPHAPGGIAGLHSRQDSRAPDTRTGYRRAATASMARRDEDPAVELQLRSRADRDRHRQHGLGAWHARPGPRGRRSWPRTPTTRSRFGESGVLPYREERDGISVLRLPLWIGRATRRRTLSARAELSCSLSPPRSRSSTVRMCSCPHRLRSRLCCRLWRTFACGRSRGSCGCTTCCRTARRRRVWSTKAAWSSSSRDGWSEPRTRRRTGSSCSRARSPRIWWQRACPPEKIELIYDPATRVPGADAAGSADTGGLRILSMGNIGHSQGLTALVRAFEAAPEAQRRHQLVITGTGVAADEARAEIRSDGCRCSGWSTTTSSSVSSSAPTSHS